MSFLSEIRRRNVVRVAGLYLVAAWLIVQVAGTVLPMFDAPTSLSRSIVIALAVGFVPALIFAWAFELTPEGLKLESAVERSESITVRTGKSLDRLIMVGLACAAGYFAFDKFVLAPRREAEQAAAARSQGRDEALLQSHGDKSIAVLPFVDLSPGRDQRYFSDGIAEELLNLLTKVPQLRVTSRSSAFSFRDKNLDATQIGRRLHVAHVLEGSVRKSGNRVRVAAQLIDTGTDTQVWSETYDRTLDDIFAVQDEISAAVVARLKVALLGDAPRVQRVDARTFELFLQGRQFARLHTPAGYAKSVELYGQGLAIDPSYAPAWTGLAYDYRRQANNGIIPLQQGYTLAADALRRALAIDPDFAPAHAELGRIALDHDRDMAAAARHLEHAFSLEPSNPDIIGYCAMLYDSLGRIDQGIALNRFALERDPVNPTLQNALALEYWYSGRVDEAIEGFRRVLALSPGDIGPHAHIADALMLKGEHEAALEEIQKEPFEAWRMIGLASVYHALGRRADADAALAALIEKYGKTWAYSIAYVLARRGEVDRSFEFLETALTEHDQSLSDLAIDPMLVNLHQDPRWLPFLAKAGKAPEQLAGVQFNVAPVL